MAKEQTYSTAYINDLVKRSRSSRATVYRKLGAGWSDAEIIAGRRDEPSTESESVDDLFPAAKPKLADPPAEEPDSIEPPDDIKFAVTWARSVLWAADNVDEKKSRMTKAKAGSALKYNLYLLGKNDLRELHVNLVPKALSILDKNKNPEGGDIAAAEEKNCDELEGILKQALEESRQQWIERN